MPITYSYADIAIDGLPPAAKITFFVPGDLVKGIVRGVWRILSQYVVDTGSSINKQAHHLFHPSSVPDREGCTESTRGFHAFLFVTLLASLLVHMHDRCQENLCNFKVSKSRSGLKCGAINLVEVIVTSFRGNSIYVRPAC
jgi:hypothetical protein